MIVEVDALITGTRLEAIEQAAVFWNRYTRREIVISTVLDTGDWLVLPAFTGLYKGGPEQYLAWAEARFHIVRLHPSLDDDRVYEVMRHELGHVLGMSDIDSGIMGSDFNPQEPTAADMAECRRVGAC